jgi:hypothetical protein
MVWSDICKPGSIPDSAELFLAYRPVPEWLSDCLTGLGSQRRKKCSALAVASLTSSCQQPWGPNAMTWVRQEQTKLGRKTMLLSDPAQKTFTNCLHVRSCLENIMFAYIVRSCPGCFCTPRSHDHICTPLIQCFNRLGICLEPGTAVYNLL